MKIRILKDTHWRISSAASIAYRAGTQPNVPHKIAKGLMARGDAEPVSGKTDDTLTEKEN